MMIDAVIFYGSRARNDGDPGSDTDLLGVSKEGLIQKTYDDLGVSFHVYPLQWLLAQSEGGALFLLHLTTEATAIFDPDNLLRQIKDRFRFKDSYQTEMEIGARVAIATTNGNSREFRPASRIRYFWGVRTALMAAAADRGVPAFSAKALQDFCQIEGLANHIHTRRTASFQECREIGRRVFTKLEGLPADLLSQDASENLRALLRFGGLGAVTAGSLIYGL